MTFRRSCCSSFRQGLPESSHKDVKLQVYSYAKSSSCEVSKLPSMAMDSGIQAGMTANFVIMRIAVTTGLIRYLLIYRVIQRLIWPGTQQRYFQGVRILYSLNYLCLIRQLPVYKALQRISRQINPIMPF